MIENGERVNRVHTDAGEALSPARRRGGHRRGLVEETAMVVVLDELRDLVVDEPRVDLVGLEVGVLEEALEEGDVGGHAIDFELAEGPIGAIDDVREIGRGRVGDQFRQQRIETGAGAIASVAKGIDADAGSGRDFKGGQRTPGGPGGAIGGHRLHVDADLQREAARGGNVRLLNAEIRERLARRELQLNLHEVESGHLFGDGVFDLEAGVGFDERVVGVVSQIVCIDDELEGAEIVVLDGLGQMHGRCGESGA